MLVRSFLMAHGPSYRLLPRDHIRSDLQEVCPTCVPRSAILRSAYIGGRYHTKDQSPFTEINVCPTSRKRQGCQLAGHLRLQWPKHSAGRLAGKLKKRQSCELYSNAIATQLTIASVIF